MIVSVFYLRLYNLHFQKSITDLFFSGANGTGARRWWSPGPVWELRTATALDLPGSQVERVSSVRVCTDLYPR